MARSRRLYLKAYNQVPLNPPSLLQALLSVIFLSCARCSSIEWRTARSEMRPHPFSVPGFSLLFTLTIDYNAL